MRFEEAYEGWSEGRLTQAAAAQILGMCERSFRRYLSRYKAEGLEGLIDRRLEHVSTLGSLFLSEVMGFAPCILCWYQRIAMYPLVLLLPIGLFPFDRNIVRYAAPLAVSGVLISVFHLLLVAGYIPENIKPCVQGIPCSEVQVQWFGFLTIPLLSALSFLLITALLILTHLRSSK